MKMVYIDEKSFKARPTGILGRRYSVCRYMNYKITSQYSWTQQLKSLKCLNATKELV